jgi:hypothetical protein
MRSSNVRGLISLAIGACLGTGILPLRSAEPDSAPAADVQATQEKEECIGNLKAIYQAVQAYEVDHKDLPNWLSDLVPKYVSDTRILICPVCRRTGKIESAPLTDPKISTSYLFEFCPLPLGRTAPAAPNETRREWKRRQMGLVGSVVPIVRCRHHDRVLNLAFDGTLYESALFWEWNFTNRVSAASLTAARLFVKNPGSGEKAAEPPPPARMFPARASDARPQLLDLTSFYNGLLTESWSETRKDMGNDLSGLPVGIQTFGGIDFDVRGVVQLRGSLRNSTNYPPAVKGIPVRQKCRRLHFLHAAAYGKATDEGREIGTYLIHYANQQLRLEAPIVYGETLRDWHTLADELESTNQLQVVWTGQNTVSRRANKSIRLFMTTWTNVVPDSEIHSIDFLSSLAVPAPFLIAITVE